MTAATPPAPLAHLHGHPPEAPGWFTAALAVQPRRGSTRVTGIDIETLAWGEPGRPGLVLVHGKTASADWWSFIAPYFAASHHVVALSLGGMGGSGWRDSYSVEAMADEVMAVCEDHGLFRATTPPLVVAHSFGGFVSLVCAAEHGSRFGGMVLVDVPLMSREQRQARAGTGAIRGALKPQPTRVYASLASALARFRFAPPQPCDHPYIADHIARSALRPATTEHGTPGWTWRFDPRVVELRAGPAAERLQSAACPMAILWGEDSALVTPEVVDYMAGLARPGTPLIEIPHARHHVMVDEPLAFVGALRGLFSTWPAVRAANR